jgi:GNAT superfamily N-acetyltransferase
MARRIRQAGYADLEAAARAKALSWGESLGGVVTDEALRRQLEPQWLDRAAAHWRGVLDGGGYVWLVVDDGGEVAGVAHASLGRDDDAPTPLELVTIYLREAAQGSGVADALLAMTIGDAPAYLWVLTGNDRAQSFYRRHGFTPEGVRVPVEGLGTTKERWVRGKQGADAPSG